MTPKPARKLPVRREVLRQLHELDKRDLDQVRGGESEATCVTHQAVPQSAGVDCRPG